MNRIPTLLSFYALSNGTQALIIGQLTRIKSSDLTFSSYGRRRTFRTLLALYRAKAIADQSVTLQFESLSIETKTDSSGSFFIKQNVIPAESILKNVLLSTGESVVIMDGMYSRGVHLVSTPYIIISDIDDTLLHSYISNRFRQVRTLLFTPIERRKAVVKMKELIIKQASKGATAIYLSNSEQNLYPLIYRFLRHHDFPPGPLFLKQMRRLWDVIRYRRLSGPLIHKMKVLDELIPMFASKKFALLGDNTQHDLTVYLAAAEKYPNSIRHIIIRKVERREEDREIIHKVTPRLSASQINLYYDETLPSSFDW